MAGVRLGGECVVENPGHLVGENRLIDFHQRAALIVGRELGRAALGSSAQSLQLVGRSGQAVDGRCEFANGLPGIADRDLDATRGVDHVADALVVEANDGRAGAERLEHNSARRIAKAREDERVGPTELL